MPDRDDVAQQILLDAFRARPCYQGTSRLSTWVYSLSLRRVADHFRSPQRCSGPAASEDGEALAGGSSPTELGVEIHTLAGDGICRAFDISEPMVCSALKGSHNSLRRAASPQPLVHARCRCVRGDSSNLRARPSTDERDSSCTENGLTTASRGESASESDCCSPRAP
jgi:hypothetical protein